MYLLLKMVGFHCYVSVPEGIFCNYLGTRMTFLKHFSGNLPDWNIGGGTWRIMPRTDGKRLMMVSCCPLTRVVPFPNSF